MFDTKSRLAGVAGLALAFVTIAACGSEEDPESSLPSAADLRPGYSVLLATGDNTAFNQRIVQVTDVAVRGEVIAVAAVQIDTSDYLGGGAYLGIPGGRDVSSGAVNSRPVYFLSRDAGTSWTQHEVTPREYIPVYQGGAPGIALTADGGAIVKLGIQRTNAAEVAFLYAAIGTVDLDSGSWKRTYSGELYGALREADGLVYSADSVAEIRVGSPDGYGNYFWFVVDGATGALVSGSSAAFTPFECVAAELYPVADAFAGLCAYGGQICYLAIDPRADTALRSSFCAPESALSDTSGPIRQTGVGPLLPYTRDGHARGFAMRFGFGPEYDLGPGRARQMTTHGFHEPFPMMVMVEDEVGFTAAFEFLLSETGPVSVPLPPTPCRAGGKCPGANGSLQVAWAQRTGLDEHFIIHDMRSRKGQLLTFGRERRLAPLPSTELPTCAAPAAANALWKACYGEVLCGMDELGACLLRWSRVTEAPLAERPALAAFLAADVSQCAALAAADSGVAPPPWDDQGVCTARCDGAKAVTCTDGVLDCPALNGGTCTLAATGAAQCLGDATACDVASAAGCDAAGRVLDCAGGKLDDCPARGLQCADVQGFFRCTPDPDPCEDGSGSFCQDGVFTQCNYTDVAPNQRVGRTFERADCQVLGQTCTVDGCSEPEPALETCQQQATICRGSTLVVHTVGQRTIDCADFGATCGPSPTGSGLACLR